MVNSSSSSPRATLTKTRSEASTTLIMSYHDFDASYVLMRNKYGRVLALYVGPHHKRLMTCVWIPKYLVTNIKGPKQIWVPKTRLKFIL
jgi:hypothetical protein